MDRRHNIYLYCSYKLVGRKLKKLTTSDRTIQFRFIIKLTWLPFPNMKKIIYILSTFIISSCATVDKHYCISGDSSSVTYIDLKNPFLAFEKNKKKNIKFLVDNIAKIGKIDTSLDFLNESKALIDKISGYDFLSFTALWTAFKGQPCDATNRKEYNDAIKKSMEIKMNLEKAVKTSQSILKSEGIGGKNKDELLYTLRQIVNEIK